MSYPFIVSGQSITIFIDGVPNAVDDSNPNFPTIKDLLVSGGYDVEEMKKLVSVQETIKQAIGQDFGDVTVGSDAIYYRGEVVNSHLTTRMLEILKEGISIEPWAKFMNKLYQNPSRTAVTELFAWLEKSGMPITTGGNFLAYKKVADDYSSFHKGPRGEVVMNLVGTRVEMPRNEVEDNRAKTCSHGLHFCSWSYLPHYYGTRGRVVILEIDPSEVVSIPSDYNDAKGRAAGYRIIGEIAQDKAQFAFNDVHVYDDDDDYDL